MTQPLPAFMPLTRLPNDPYHPRGRWVIHCHGCRTGFKAEGAERDSVEQQARVHLASDNHGRQP